jgi:hypothetical protein
VLTGGDQARVVLRHAYHVTLDSIDGVLGKNQIRSSQVWTCHEAKPAIAVAVARSQRHNLATQDAMSGGE